MKLGESLSLRGLHGHGDAEAGSEVEVEDSAGVALVLSFDLPEGAGEEALALVDVETQPEREDGLLVVEIKTEGKERLDIEIGTGGTIRAEASASLSPGEARTVAAELVRLADELDEYRTGDTGPS